MTDWIEDAKAQYHEGHNGSKFAVVKGLLAAVIALSVEVRLLREGLQGGKREPVQHGVWLENKPGDWVCSCRGGHVKRVNEAECSKCRALRPEVVGE